MELLERYLKQVEKYLPFKERKETLKELKSLILDQVDTLTSSLSNEDALYKVIVEMGEPREVASKYYDAKPMFSKEMEPILMLVLKIVSITLPLVVLFANSLEYIFATNDLIIMEFLLDFAYTIPSAVYSLLVAYGFIFIIFYLIERYIQPKFEVVEKEFNPNLLPNIPAKVFKVSIIESVLTILLTCLMLYLFNLNRGLIAVYYDGGSVPLFNENFDKIVTLMNIAWFLNIAIHVYYLFKRKKSILTKTIELFFTIFVGIILFILAGSNAFNEVVIDTYDINFVPKLFMILMILSGIGIIIGGIVEYVKMFVNLEALDELKKNKS